MSVATNSSVYARPLAARGPGRLMRLATALRVATTDPGMRRRCAALGERIRAEDGVARAVATFERHFGRPSRATRSTSAGATQR